MRLLTIPETARFLRRHPETVRRMIRRKELGGVLRHGGGWVSTTAIHELLGESITLRPRDESEDGTDSGVSKIASTVDGTTVVLGLPLSDDIVSPADQPGARTRDQDRTRPAVSRQDG